MKSTTNLKEHTWYKPGIVKPLSIKKFTAFCNRYDIVVFTDGYRTWEKYSIIELINHFYGHDPQDDFPFDFKFEKRYIARSYAYSFLLHHGIVTALTPGAIQQLTWSLSAVDPIPEEFNLIGAFHSDKVDVFLTALANIPVEQREVIIDNYLEIEAAEDKKSWTIWHSK